MSQLQVTVTKSASIGFEFSTNWATVHDSSSGGIFSESEIHAKVESLSGGDNAYGIQRGFMTFNTDTIPDGATIHSALLELHGGVSGNTVHVVTNNQASNTSITGDDYDQLGGSSLASFTPNGGAGYANQVSVPVANIAKIGYTKLGLRQNYDLANSPPPLGSGPIFNAFDGSAETYPARLTIQYTLPATVTTGAVTNIKQRTATLGGNVTDAGGGTVSERGVCWSLTSNPTTSNSKAPSAGSTGAYTVGATNLIAGKVYHYRAYVITENGTQYGSDLTFRTRCGGALVNFFS